MTVPFNPSTPWLYGLTQPTTPTYVAPQYYGPTYGWSAPSYTPPYTGYLPQGGNYSSQVPAGGGAPNWWQRTIDAMRREQQRRANAAEARQQAAIQNYQQEIDQQAKDAAERAAYQARMTANNYVYGQVPYSNYDIDARTRDYYNYNTVNLPPYTGSPFGGSTTHYRPPTNPTYVPPNWVAPSGYPGGYHQTQPFEAPSAAVSNAQSAWDAGSQLWGAPPNQILDIRGQPRTYPGTMPMPGYVTTGRPPALTPPTDYGGYGGGYGGYGGYGGGYGGGGGYKAPKPGVNEWMYGIVNWRVSGL